jgi:hypothetical protein
MGYMGPFREGNKSINPLKALLRGGGVQKCVTHTFLLLDIQFLRMLEVKNLFDSKIKLQKILSFSSVCTSNQIMFKVSDKKREKYHTK